MSKTSLTTPRFIKAANPKQLERLMLQNNLKRRAWHNYQIAFDGKAWYAWYYADLSGSMNQEIEEIHKTDPAGG